MAKPQLDVGAAGLVPDGKTAPGPAEPACVNCGAVLRGDFCHACGQSADLKKRNVVHLVTETVASLVNYDNRLVRTLVLLFLRPGVLAKDMIEGRIVRHTPPFQTFLVSASLFILASNFSLQYAPEPLFSLRYTPEAAQLPRPGSDAPAPLPAPTASLEGPSAAELDPLRQALMSDWGLSATQAEKFIQIIQRPDGDENLSANIVSEFGKLLIYLLPFMTIVLKLMYFKRKDLYFHDHFLVSCYICSFILIPLSIASVVPIWTELTFPIIVLWNAVNTHHVMRVGYDSSRIGAILKTGVLWVGAHLILLGLLVGAFISSMLQA